ncbi:MAG TPA: YXWGXW repeat-containing protein [Steroidobacteraceae bacterium]|jgi:hypothetical protein|nr:YXWGXW repeat-containing protein [Steroidobacteraceae bacterium]
MKRLFRLESLCLLGALAMTAIPACVVTPDQRHYADGVVMVAPPAPQVEVVGTPPQPGYLWVGGYWDWVGARHQWVAGHWAPPRRGYHWVATEWVRQGDGWRLRRGHWQRG